VAPASTRANVSAARACAYTVVRRVFEQGAYADRALYSQAAQLDGRDRALAMTLAYGTVQRRATLDHVIGALSSRPPADLDPPVLAALRLGLMQLLLLDGIAEHAAIHESVELAKRDGHGGAGLVNAVLRRATRDGRGLIQALSDETLDGAATLHSVPRWIAELWWSELGPEEARGLLRRINEPAEAALRVNTLVASVDAVAAELGVPVVPAAGLPEGLVLGGPFDVYGSELWARGAIMPQSRGSMLVGRALAPRPGERVLDLCAAPGAKTTQLAAMMGDRGAVTAVERHAGRATALRRTLERMGVACATVREADASQRGDGAAVHDRVLVDPPCSGLGTLQSRPDLRWRASPERLAETAGLQARVLRAGAAQTRPGGTLVYSVCTISRAEGELVVDRFLSEHPEFSADPLEHDIRGAVGGGSDAGASPYLQVLPHRDHTDGFFIARLRRD
jgi:16S rRNA (cytosine967-C5)-methyltransferase